ncbi:MAG: MoaD/ThiS family protein [Syntrophaceae bacterium]
MKIEVNLFASLARYMRDKTGIQGSRLLEIEEGTTIIDILTRMEVPLDKVKILFLNGIHATGDEVLKEGDRVGVFPPVAGG